MFLREIFIKIDAWNVRKVWRIDDKKLDAQNTIIKSQWGTKIGESNATNFNYYWGLRMVQICETNNFPTLELTIIFPVD